MNPETVVLATVFEKGNAIFSRFAEARRDDGARRSRAYDDIVEFHHRFHRSPYPSRTSNVSGRSARRWPKIPRHLAQQLRFDIRNVFRDTMYQHPLGLRIAHLTATQHGDPTTNSDLANYRIERLVVYTPIEHDFRLEARFKTVFVRVS
jgi:hypothetical protein